LTGEKEMQSLPEKGEKKAEKEEEKKGFFCCSISWRVVYCEGKREA